MKRVLKWAGAMVVGVVGVLVLASALVYFQSQSRLNRVYSVSPPPVRAAAAAPSPNGGEGLPAGRIGGGVETDSDANRASAPDAGLVAWGEHIAATRGCGDCHGADLGGAVFAEAMPVMRLIGSNLTPGGVGATYSDGDWVRAIRHGVGPDGKGLLFMPSYEYYYLGDEDLAALIAYLKSRPAVTRELPGSAVGPVGRALLVTGKLPLLAAEMIDHDGPRPTAPPKGATVAYGEYLAAGCTGCHGADFSGGPIPGVPPEWPPAANLTPDPETGIGRWSRADFLAAVTEGRRPDGRQLQPQFMPWPNLARFQPDELEALWMYFQTVESRPFGGR